MAICSGVAAVSNWPIEDSAVCEELIPVLKTLGTTPTGMSRVALKPNFTASWSILVSPISAPSLAKTVLQEYVSARVSDALVQGSLALSFGR